MSSHRHRPAASRTAKSEIPDKKLPPALKRLGQNFLNDATVLRRIVDSLQLEPGEVVVEIGAGRGSLTEVLAQQQVRVIAIELDRALVPFLRSNFADRVEVVEGDALKLNVAELAGGPYKLVGNVPYYITTPLIFSALTTPRPSVAVFLMQKEVAERAASPPGSGVYGALSVNLQVLMSAEVLFGVSAGSFVPRPKVESAVLKLTPLREPLVTPDEEAGFQAFVRQIFAQRRKQLLRILRGVGNLSPDMAKAILDELGVESAARPDMLSPAQFVQLFRAVRSSSG